MATRQAALSELHRLVKREDHKGVVAQCNKRA
jgi:hypothetical protein